MVQGTRGPRPHNLAHIHRDRGYRFEDRDPKMVQLCTIITQSEMSTYEISQKTAEMTRGVYKVATSTMDNWLSGKTKRPQNFTMMWVGYALGYEARWVKVGS